MPNQPKTPVSRFRIAAEEWRAFGEALPDDTDRSAILREFVAWYLRRPGAKLPTRPSTSGTSSRSDVRDS
ncbi:hypothetical protein ACIP79_08120 [Streptomyces sp. NPDC088747]|uniref:hypothetical protein n=1 Tax=Streptomyces sp. NPDC088747 TaxID=3365886 RepID=UPI0037F4A5BF